MITINYHLSNNEDIKGYGPYVPLIGDTVQLPGYVDTEVTTRLFTLDKKGQLTAEVWLLIRR